MRANGNLPSLTGAACGWVLGLEPLNSCIAHPPGFPGLELAVPHDAAAGIETLVEHALGDTVAGIEHSLLDLPTPDSLNVDTVFGPSYSRLTRTGLDDATAKGIARWGGAVFFISNHLAEAREQMAWHADDRRAVERRKAKDAIDTRLASRLAGRWGGTEGAQLLRNQVHDRANNAPKPDRRSVNARLAVATLEGRLNYLLLTGGVSSRSAIGLAALLDARGWGEIAALVASSGLMQLAIGRYRRPKPIRRSWPGLGSTVSPMKPFVAS
jgi:hypothetical protein